MFPGGVMMFFNKILNALKVENLYPNSGYSFENPSDSLKTTADSCDEFQKMYKNSLLKKYHRKTSKIKARRTVFLKTQYMNLSKKSL